MHKDTRRATGKLCGPISTTTKCGCAAKKCDAWQAETHISWRVAHKTFSGFNSAKGLWRSWPCRNCYFVSLKKAIHIFNKKNNHGGRVRRVRISNASSACMLSDFGIWDIWCDVGQRDQSAPCSSPLLGMFVETRITYNLHKLAKKRKTLWKAVFRMPSNIKSSVNTHDEGKGKKKTFGKSTTAAIGRIATVASWSLCADIPGTDSC